MFYSSVDVYSVVVSISRHHFFQDLSLRVLRSSDQFYIVSYYIKWVTTSWTYSSYVFLLIWTQPVAIFLCQDPSKVKNS